jgi:hypothetical protein
LQKLFYNRVWRGRQWATAPIERAFDGRSPFVPVEGERDEGEEVESAQALRDRSQRFFVVQGSSVSLPAETGSVDAVVTDPPYYDSIQYGDLAAFFRVWLRQFLPDAADWRYDESAAAVNSERDTEDGRYQQLMTGIFHECRRVLQPERGRLIFTFHHWQPRAWSALTVALYSARFTLLNRYVVHAEHLMSVHISKMRALTHDAILVLAPPGSTAGPEWKRPGRIARGESRLFTKGCASFLGWVLSQPALSPDRIRQLWDEALSGIGDER